MRSEFAKGGGKLFKWIASEETMFLNVNLSAMVTKCISLNKFVQGQTHSWSKYWAPANGSAEDVAAAFTALWHNAREFRN